MEIYYSKGIFCDECNTTLDIPDESIINKILHGNRQQRTLRKQKQKQYAVMTVEKEIIGPFVM